MADGSRVKGIVTTGHLMLVTDLMVVRIKREDRFGQYAVAVIVRRTVRNVVGHC